MKNIIPPQGPFKIVHVSASHVTLEHWAVIDVLNICRGIHSTEKAARNKVGKLNKNQPIHIAVIPVTLTEGK